MRLSSRGESRLVTTVATAPLLNVIGGHRHVLELDRTSDPGRTSVDGLPRAHQVEKQVDLMNAVPQRRAAALAGPGATPLRQEVAVGAVPQGLADGDPRRTQRARTEQMVGATRTRSVTVLEHHVEGARAHLLGGGEDIHVGQVRGRRLLQEYRAARLEQFDGDLGVTPGRRGDGHQVRLLIEELTAGAVCRRLVACGVLIGSGGDDVEDANQLDAGVVLVAQGMRTGDRATSDDPDAELFLASRPVHCCSVPTSD